jgi:hypothetical protein
VLCWIPVTCWIPVSILRHPTHLEMAALITNELEECSPQVRSAFATHLIDLQPKPLKWEYGNSEEFPSWVFADMKERSVYAAYCMGGHGALGSPWGLVFLHDDYFGMDSGWFQSLSDLLLDWGIGSNV